MTATTTAPTAVAIAFRAQRELQALTHPDYSADTRQSTIEEYRRSYAQAVAEAETGIDSAQNRMASQYGSLQFDDAFLRRVGAYRLAYMVALRSIPTDMAGALEFFETAAGVRREQKAA